jgi:hypothetical protein
MDSRRPNYDDILSSATGERLSVEEYDPFARGTFSAGVRTVEARNWGVVPT